MSKLTSPSHLATGDPRKVVMWHSLRIYSISRVHDPLREEVGFRLIRVGRYRFDVDVWTCKKHLSVRAVSSATPQHTRIYIYIYHAGVLL